MFKWDAPTSQKPVSGPTVGAVFQTQRAWTKWPVNGAHIPYHAGSSPVARAIHSFIHSFIMSRSIGVAEFLARKFDVLPFEGKWKDSFAEPEKNFRMVVYGKPGNGKTEFCIQLAKYISQFKKVFYNSYEQGISKSLQDAIVRNNMEECKGRVMFGDRVNFKDLMAKLKGRNSAQVVFIDSRDNMGLTYHQYDRLVKTFPRKSFIIICWESSGKPKGEHGKSIEFMVDIKLHVRNYRAYPRCRFGGNRPYVIWDKPNNRERNLFNQT